MSEWLPDESAPTLTDQERSEIVSVAAWSLVRSERERLVASKLWYALPLGYTREIARVVGEVDGFVSKAAAYDERSREEMRGRLALVAALAWRALEEDLGEASWNP